MEKYKVSFHKFNFNNIITQMPEMPEIYNTNYNTSCTANKSIMLYNGNQQLHYYYYYDVLNR